MKFSETSIIFLRFDNVILFSQVLKSYNGAFNGGWGVLDTFC